jgi:hypothetical protein
VSGKLHGVLLGKMRGGHRGPPTAIIAAASAVAQR